jgi:GNAT superfamily N-acetyltransferase
MAAIETLRQADIRDADIPAALALSDAARWNQTAADWGVFIAHGRAVGLFTEERALVATAAVLPYAAGFGWISMVIVAADWQRRGLARRLMDHCTALLLRERCTAFLDATPAGAEVYGALGFQPLARLERWEGEGGGAEPGDRKISVITPGETAPLIAADRDAFGSERRFLIDAFMRRPGTLALACDGGYLVMRRGQRAVQLGPFVASSAMAAEALLAGAIARSRGPVFLDLFETWNGLVPLLEARGFRRQRPFLRMAHGRSALPGDPARLVCAAGPEFG